MFGNIKQGVAMSNSPVKEWLADHEISYRDLASRMGQSPASISQKLNKQTPWQQRDLLFLHDEYGLSSDFVLGISSSEEAM